MKLPVIKAFSATFAFVFGNFVDVIKIMWLPLAIIAGIAVYSMKSILATTSQMLDVEAQMDPAHPDPTAMFHAMAPMMSSLGLIFLAEIILFPMILAGLLRYVIRGEKPGLVYFRFAGDELRILGTIILQVLLLMGVYIALVVIAALLGGALGAFAPKNIAALSIMVVVCAAFAFMIWICLRLSLSLPAAVGAKGIGIGPSWSATKGAVWSLLFYWVLWGILLFIADGILISITMPGYFSEMSQMIQAASQHGSDAAAANQEMIEWNRRMMESMSGRAPILIGVGAVFALIVYPLLICAGGIAYRYLTEGDSAAGGEA